MSGSKGSDGHDTATGRPADGLSTASHPADARTTAGSEPGERGLRSGGKGPSDRPAWPRLEEVRRLRAELPIQAVALDVDGTILRSDLRVARRTRMAVRALRAQGIRVIIATGRRIGTAARYARQAGAGPSCDIVSLDGALVTEAGGRHVLRAVPVDPAAARQILVWAQDLGLTFVVNTQSHLYGTPARAPARVIQEHRRRGILRSVTGTLHTLWEIPPLRPAGRLDVRREGMLKFSPMGPREAAAELRERIERADLPVHLTTPGGPYYEVVPRGVTKGEGLTFLLERRGIDPRHTLAIGDGWNDVQMFLRVGHSIAMGNAHSGVKAYARWVTLDVDEGGVAEVLERVAAGSWPPSDALGLGEREHAASREGTGPDPGRTRKAGGSEGDEG